jgi:hypothetical protein
MRLLGIAMLTQAHMQVVTVLNKRREGEINVRRISDDRWRRQNW